MYAPLDQTLTLAKQGLGGIFWPQEGAAAVNEIQKVAVEQPGSVIRPARGSLHRRLHVLYPELRRFVARLPSERGAGLPPLLRLAPAECGFRSYVLDYEE